MSIMQSAPETVEATVEAVFGSPFDPMPVVEARAAELLGPEAMVWEADAVTVIFSYVGKSAEAVLGYPVSRWTEEPTFWADVVLHGDDRDGAITYCVAETSACRDHAFVYRAVAADGRIVRLRDYVQVITGEDGKPSLLRGVMVAVPEDEA